LIYLLREALDKSARARRRRSVWLRLGFGYSREFSPNESESRKVCSQQCFAGEVASHTQLVVTIVARLKLRLLSLATLHTICGFSDLNRAPRRLDQSPGFGKKNPKKTAPKGAVCLLPVARITSPSCSTVV